MACPVPLIQKGEKNTGLRLLERYGITKLGMVLTNSRHEEFHSGYVGTPFPSLQVQLADDNDSETTRRGELRVKGDVVFESYWNQTGATLKAFDDDGWFKTGDLVEFSKEKQSYRKWGGYKLSAV